MTFFEPGQWDEIIFGAYSGMIYFSVGQTELIDFQGMSLSPLSVCQSICYTDTLNGILVSIHSYGRHLQEGLYMTQGLITTLTPDFNPLEMHQNIRNSLLALAEVTEILWETSAFLHLPPGAPQKAPVSCTCVNGTGQDPSNTAQQSSEAAGALH